MIKKFQKYKFNNSELDRVQDNVEKFSEQFTNIEILDGQSITNLRLTSGIVNEVEHKLGRELQGWIITRIRGNAIVWDDQDVNKKKSLTLRLVCNSNVTVDLWVF